MRPVSERCRQYLEQAAAGSAERLGWSPLLARLWHDDRDTAADWLRGLLDECRRRQDCTDFRLNLLLRALRLFPERIDGKLRDAIRDTALAARYYGGFSRDYPMFYNSENHHLNWAAAEYLAGQFWPEATLSHDGQSGETHRLRAAFIIARWVHERARWGFWEWNSSCYMGVNLLSLLNLYDFAADPVMRRLAGDALTLMLADLAADSAGGGIWAAQARLYEPQLFSAAHQGAAAPFNLLMGLGDPAAVKPDNVADFVATTTWQPPEWLSGLARKLDPPLLNRERHRQMGNLFYSCHSAFWKPPVELWRSPWTERFIPEEVGEIALCTERCPAYLVSTAFFPDPARNHRGGAQSMMWMSALKGRVPIFVNQPAQSLDAHGRSRYWAGNAVLPRCYLSGGVVGAVFHSTADSHPGAADLTHAWFPTADMTETMRQGDWFLGRVEAAYIALRGMGAGRAVLTAQGEWAGREIRLPGRTAGWVGVYGSADTDGDFAQFTQRVAAMQVQFDSASALLTVADRGKVMRIAYAGDIQLDGQSVSTGGWRQLENPVCHSDWGSPVLHFRAPSGAAGQIDLAYAGAMAETLYDRF